ncbi:hypothetical protein [Streptosporangium canum]|uniref:hypothetical protein n=1 Tax=Streptosporangium canum TaxID=324952 RepID=UPI0037950D3B
MAGLAYGAGAITAAGLLRRPTASIPMDARGSVMAATLTYDTYDQALNEILEKGFRR